MVASGSHYRPARAGGARGCFCRYRPLLAGDDRQTPGETTDKLQVRPGADAAGGGPGLSLQSGQLCVLLQVVFKTTLFSVILAALPSPSGFFRFTPGWRFQVKSQTSLRWDNKRTRRAQRCKVGRNFLVPFHRPKILFHRFVQLN